VFLAWRSEVGPLPEPLVLRLPLCAPHAAPLSVACWWPRGQERAHWASLQRYILERPGCHPMLWLPRQPAGQQATAVYLCSASSAEAAAAVLICALLQPFTSEARNPVARSANQSMQLHVYQLARQAAGLPLQPWHHASRSLLPELSYGHEHVFGRSDAVRYRCFDYGELAAAIGRHHRALLDAWRPVELIADEAGDYELVQQSQEQIAERRAAEHREHRERLVAWEAQRAEEARTAEERRQLHPRVDEWPPSAELLRELVWSMPTTAVANEFGVSDVAVGKLCARLGVEKPPRGFWRKVEAGLIRHPQGRPPPSTSGSCRK
jgi:hypothetical protein